MEGTVRPGSIVVGLDSSGASLDALDWATAHAERDRAPLHLVTADVAELSELGWGMGSRYDAVRRRGDQLLARARHRIRLRDSTLEVSTSHPESFPAGPLIRASRRARMVVLGCHGETLAHLGSLGATAHQVASHAASPVAVVRSGVVPGGDFRRVSVGVDVSEDDRALDWAFQEADRTDSELLVLHAWQPRDARDPGLSQDASWEDYAAGCARHIAARVAGLQRRHPDVKVRTEVSQGNPVKTLVRESQTSDVLVVGARGSGGFDGLELGHVAHHAIARAGCPVLVAR